MLEIQELNHEQIRNLTLRVKLEIDATEFHDLFLESLDRVLIDLVGPRVRESIYGHVDRELGISRSDIPEHIDEFWTRLDEVMGRASKVAQKRVLERLYEMLQMKCTETGSLQGSMTMRGGEEVF